MHDEDVRNVYLGRYGRNLLRTVMAMAVQTRTVPIFLRTLIMAIMIEGAKLDRS